MDWYNVSIKIRKIGINHVHNADEESESNKLTIKGGTFEWERSCSLQSWISICSDREPIMTFTGNKEPIRRYRGVRKVYILLCGHQMPDQFLLLESLITGIHRQIQ